MKHLIQARDSAQFVAAHLNQALTKADAVEALVIIPMIGTVACLVSEISALISAVEDTPKIDKEVVELMADALQAANEVLPLLPDTTTNNNGTTRIMSTREAQRRVTRSLQLYILASSAGVK